MSKRITPAGAGKTWRKRRLKKYARDHPRRCGENGWITDTQAITAGSPPQVRGKLALIANLPQIIGITPAGAGKTLGSGRSAVGIRDHPRRCGENFFVTPFLLAVSRITPAGAGKTIVATESTDKITDHPRRCGENGIFLPLPISGLGSPPQVRGKRFLMNLKKKNNGITPAGAGKTLPAWTNPKA